MKSTLITREKKSSIARRIAAKSQKLITPYVSLLCILHTKALNNFDWISYSQNFESYDRLSLSIETLFSYESESLDIESSKLDELLQEFLN